MSVISRNNVHVRGRADGRAMVFAPGYGCDQHVWRHVAPALEADFRTVLFDLVGAGKSDLSAYDPAKYASLAGYAADLVEIGRELGLRDAVFVGHSVSAIIGVLASLEAPELFSDLVLVGPSPRYIDDSDYVGGFSTAGVPVRESDGVVAGHGARDHGNPERPEFGEELAESFCRTDPAIAAAFARTTFTSDNRADLPKVEARTLILQCSEHIIAPTVVGEYVNRHIRESKLVILGVTGHCPNLSAPDEVITAIKNFVYAASARLGGRWRGPEGPLRGRPVWLSRPVSGRPALLGPTPLSVVGWRDRSRT